MAHLIFQTAFPGDLFLSIPLIKRLRVWDKKSEIVLACRPGLGEFFKKYGLVQEVVEIDKRSPVGRRESLARLRRESWDLILVPHESVRTALWISRLHARQAKVGFAHWWNVGFFEYRVICPQHLPDALRQLSLLQPLDIEMRTYFESREIQDLKNPESQDSPWDFQRQAIPSWASMQVLEYRPQGRVVFLAPGSVWNTKRWTQEGFAELAVRLKNAGFDVQLVGSPAERELCDWIARAAGGLKNWAGQTSLSGLVELFAQGRALICNDSGAMHAAAAAGLPVLAIFGPTTLQLGFRPWSQKAVVVQKALSCRPCGKHGAKNCPIKTHACMKDISAAQVFEGLNLLLGESPHLGFGQ